MKLHVHVHHSLPGAPRRWRRRYRFHPLARRHVTRTKRLVAPSSHFLPTQCFANACLQGNLAVAQWLAQKFREVQAQKLSPVQMLQVCQRRQWPVAEWILQQGLWHPNRLKLADSFRLLDTAFAEGRIYFVTQLVKACPHLTLGNADEWMNLLLKACASGHVALVAWWLHAFAHRTSPDQVGQAAWWAFQNHQFRVLHWILQKEGTKEERLGWSGRQWQAFAEEASHRGEKDLLVWSARHVPEYSMPVVFLEGGTRLPSALIEHVQPSAYPLLAQTILSAARATNSLAMFTSVCEAFPVEKPPPKTAAKLALQHARAPFVRCVAPAFPH